MYHDSHATSYMTVLNNHSLPSPDYTGDSDSEAEIFKELEQKRQQLDDDVSRFRVQKDKEFKAFEVELKAKRKQNRSQRHPNRNSGSHYYEFTKNSPSATPPSDPLPTACEKKVKNPDRQPGTRLIKPNAGSKVTPPTVCLDKLNIQGENVPPSHVSPLQPSPNSGTLPNLIRTTSSSSHASLGSNSSASVQSDQPRDKPPFLPESTTHEGTAPLTGLFLPGYLPLLDARYESSHKQVDGIQTTPASPTTPSMIEAVAVLASSSLPTQSSLAETFHITPTKRAYTSPSALNRAKLPPIIRNVNGKKRPSHKRKHVTFQLADRAIVEPSSSYEEGPSPDIDDTNTEGESNNEPVTPTPLRDEEKEKPERPVIQRKNTPLDPFGRRTRVSRQPDTPEDEVGKSMGDLLLGDSRTEEVQSSPMNNLSPESDGYFSPRHTPQSPRSDSPEKPATFGSVNDNLYMNKRKEQLTNKRRERSTSRSPNVSPSVSRQTSFDTGNRGVGKTLHAPYQSPRFSPRSSPVNRSMQRQYPGFLEDDLLLGSGHGGFFELDEELNSPNSENVQQTNVPEDKDEDLDLDRSTRNRGLGIEAEELTGTSVPIDIVRPGTTSASNSWLGTYGH